jgi:hypothetical protein
VCCLSYGRARGRIKTIAIVTHASCFLSGLLCLLLLTAVASTNDINFRGHAEEANGDNRDLFLLGSCPNDEDRCGRFLGLAFIPLYSLRDINGGFCEAACSPAPSIFRFFGYECGSCRCDRKWECGEPKTSCGSEEDNGYPCVCSKDVEHNSFCWLNDSCSADDCTSSSDCSGDQRCIASTCCNTTPNGVCLSPCPNPNHDDQATENEAIPVVLSWDRPGGNN